MPSKQRTSLALFSRVRSEAVPLTSRVADGMATLYLRPIFSGRFLTKKATKERLNGGDIRSFQMLKDEELNETKTRRERRKKTGGRGR